MKLICIKNFKSLKVNDKTYFTSRFKNDVPTTIPSISDISIQYYPVGSIIINNIPNFISYENLKKHFVTEKEYRKLKLQKLKTI